MSLPLATLPELPKKSTTAATGKRRVSTTGTPQPPHLTTGATPGGYVSGTASSRLIEECNKFSPVTPPDTPANTLPGCWKPSSTSPGTIYEVPLAAASGKLGVASSVLPPPGGVRAPQHKPPGGGTQPQHTVTVNSLSEALAQGHVPVYPAAYFPFQAGLRDQISGIRDISQPGFLATASSTKSVASSTPQPFHFNIQNLVYKGQMSPQKPAATPSPRVQPSPKTSATTKTHVPADAAGSRLYPHHNHVAVSGASRPMLVSIKSEPVCTQVISQTGHLQTKPSNAYNPRMSYQHASTTHNPHLYNIATQPRQSVLGAAGFAAPNRGSAAVTQPVYSTGSVVSNAVTAAVPTLYPHIHQSHLRMQSLIPGLNGTQQPLLMSALQMGAHNKSAAAAAAAVTTVPNTIVVGHTGQIAYSHATARVTSNPIAGLSHLYNNSKAETALASAKSSLMQNRRLSSDHHHPHSHDRRRISKHEDSATDSAPESEMQEHPPRRQLTPASAGATSLPGVRPNSAHQSPVNLSSNRTALHDGQPAALLTSSHHNVTSSSAVTPTSSTSSSLGGSNSTSTSDHHTAVIKSEDPSSSGEAAGVSTFEWPKTKKQMARKHMPNGKTSKIIFIYGRPDLFIPLNR